MSSAIPVPFHMDNQMPCPPRRYPAMRAIRTQACMFSWVPSGEDRDDLGARHLTLLGKERSFLCRSMSRRAPPTDHTHLMQECPASWSAKFGVGWLWRTFMSHGSFQEPLARCRMM